MKARTHGKMNLLKDDAAALAGGAYLLCDSLKQRVAREKDVHMANVAERCGFVPREDFDDLHAVVESLRTDQEELKRQIEEIKQLNVKK